MAKQYQRPTLLPHLATNGESNVRRFADHLALEARRDSLYERLDAGYQRIEHGLSEGRDITTWEDLWLTLLNEYEAVCDQLQRDLAA